MSIPVHHTPARRPRRPLELGMYRGFRIFWDQGRQGYFATETVTGRMLRQRTCCFDGVTREASLGLLLTWLDQCADAHQRLQSQRLSPIREGGAA